MSKAAVLTGTFLHITCRNNTYPKSNVTRFPVPNEYVPWSVPYASYTPPAYTAPHINGQVWADPELGFAQFEPKWQLLDGNINRASYNGEYKIDEQGYPINPIGRTGLRGRGLLGRWGPNHAADPIVTRWKRDERGNIVKCEQSKKYVHCCPFIE